VAILGDLICTTSGEFGTEFIGEIIFGIHVGGVRVGTKTIRRIGTVLEQKGKENIHRRDLQVDQLHLYQSQD
jgi:hypothetical protein